MRGAFTGLIVAGLLALFATAQAAERYDRMYAFGDSYSDTGSGFLAGNGPSAVARLAERFGLTFAHAKDPDADARSINFAVAGARTGANAGRQIGGYWLVVGMQTQVEDFVARVQRGTIRFNPDTTLFFLEGGLNDKGVPTATTLANLTHQIEQLKAVRARHVTLALLPTRIPAFHDEAVRLNPAYRQLVPELRKRLDIDLRLNRYGAYMDEVHAHPARHGIGDTRSRCAPNPLFHEDVAPCATPERYFYYYDDHPSAAVNRIVGDRLYAEIVRGTR